MKKSAFVLLTLLLTIFQFTLCPQIKLGWHNLGLMISSVIVLSAFDFKTAYISAFLCGFIADCVLGRYYCVYLITCVLCVTIFFLFGRAMNRKSVVAVLIFTFLCTLITELLQYFIFVHARSYASISFVLTKLIFPQIFYNMICSSVIYFIYSKLWKKLKLDKERWGYWCIVKIIRNVHIL